MPNQQQKETKYYLTSAGIEQIKKTHENLISIERPAAIEQLRIAREFGGDLEEGNVYTSAIERIRWIERKIVEVQEILENARLIEKRVPNGQVLIGSTVTIEIEGEKDTLFIVGSHEAQPEEGKISNESPVGRALLGKKVGEVIEVETPETRFMCKIIEIL